MHQNKVGLAVVFTDITKKEVLPEGASIPTDEITAIKVALKEIHKREDKRLVIYADSQSSMQSIENNKVNHPMLNQIYDILTELQSLDKKINLCKVPVHVGVKVNEEADKAAKEAIDTPRVTT